jgi:hypothetical protein
VRIASAARRAEPLRRVASATQLRGSKPLGVAIRFGPFDAAGGPAARRAVGRAAGASVSGEHLDYSICFTGGF